MRITQRKYFETEDGRRFDTEQEALLYAVGHHLSYGTGELDRDKVRHLSVLFSKLYDAWPLIITTPPPPPTFK